MFYGWRVVAGAFTAQLFSVGFFTYAVSMLVVPVREEFGVSLEQVMYSLTAAMFLGLVIQPLAGIMVDRISVRAMMIAGTAIFGLGLLATSYSTSIGQYILFFAVTMSLVTALNGPLCTSAVISRWFTASRGKALGIAAMGTSLGGVALPALIGWGLADGGWRTSLQLLAWVVVLVMLPVVTLTIRGRPTDVNLDTEPMPTDSTAMPGQESHMDMKDILRSSRFWLIGLSLGLLFGAYSTTLANLTPFAINLGETAERAATLIMCIAVSGFFGKILFGMAADKFSLKSSLWAAQGLVVAALLILATEPQYTLMLLGAGSLGLAAGGMLPVWGAMMAQAFGLASYGRAMGLMGPIITLCILPAYPLVGRLYDTTGSYTTGLYIFAAVTAVAAALLVPLRFTPRAGV